MLLAMTLIPMALISMVLVSFALISMALVLELVLLDGTDSNGAGDDTGRWLLADGSWLMILTDDAGR